MKKDFTQPFETGATRAYLLIEDGESGNFVVFTSPEDIDEYGEDDAYRTFDLQLDDNRTVAHQLAEYLSRYGFVLNSVRELARETKIAFSFADNTPGSEHSAAAFHVRVDITSHALFRQARARLLPLHEYADRLVGALFSDRLIELGVARLLSDREWLASEH